MLRRAKDLGGFSIGARDGDLGRVADCLFDDETWVVRFLVVETGTRLVGRRGPRLFGRTVLVPRSAVERVDQNARRVVVALTTDEVERGPGVGAHPPVSRQREAEYLAFFNAAAAAPAGGLWVPWHYAGGGREISVGTPEPADAHLRSASEVRGYRVRALDAESGRVHELLVDERLEVRYLVVDTTTWFCGRRVLVAPRSVEFISWEDRRVFVGTPKQAVETGVAYHPSPLESEAPEARISDRGRRARARS